MAPKVSKRPAASTSTSCCKKSKYTPKRVEPDTGPTWYMKNIDAVKNLEHPQWAVHFLSLFGETVWGALKQLFNGKLTINVWSDHCGMTTEMFASKHLRSYLYATYGVDVIFRLYGACDKCTKAKELTMINHSPDHFTSDIYHRNLQAGTYDCDKCQSTHALPSDGIHMYLSGFPCTPWSSRGTRTGFEHADGKQYLQTCDTISWMNPVFFCIEHVLPQNSHSDRTEYAEMIRHMGAKLPNFNILSLAGIDPRHSGYPASKPRFLAVGGRTDQIQETALC